MAEPEDRSAAHILVIDDDERLRDLLQRFLCESGFWSQLQAVRKKPAPIW